MCDSVKNAKRFLKCMFLLINKMMKSPKWPESKYYGMTKEEIKKILIWNLMKIFKNFKKFF